MVLYQSMKFPDSKANNYDIEETTNLMEEDSHKQCIWQMTNFQNI